jgi:hypothetical protein
VGRSKAGKTRGRPRHQGQRTPSGRVSRAGQVDRGTLGTRLAQARPLLSPQDAVTLSMLVTFSPTALVQAGVLNMDAVDHRHSLDRLVDEARDKLFAKASKAINAQQRRDPVGRACHEGLLDGQGIDPAALRDIGRQYGFLYWHEYRAADATIGGYTEMVALGSVKLTGDKLGRDPLGVRWQVLSSIVDPMGHDARMALQRLCVDDMWFEEGPDWLDRLINEARARRGEAVVGMLPGHYDRRTMRLALAGLVALAKGTRMEKPRRAHPFNEGPALVDRDGVELEEAEAAGALSVLGPVDPEFLADDGVNWKPWPEIADIIRSRLEEDLAA